MDVVDAQLRTLFQGEKTHNLSLVKNKLRDTEKDKDSQILKLEMDVVESVWKLFLKQGKHVFVKFLKL